MLASAILSDVQNIQIKSVFFFFELEHKLILRRRISRGINRKTIRNRANRGLFLFVLNVFALKTLNEQQSQSKNITNTGPMSRAYTVHVCQPIQRIVEGIATDLGLNVCEK